MKQSPQGHKKFDTVGETFSRVISPVVWHRHSPEGPLWEELLSWLQKGVTPEQGSEGSIGVCSPGGGSRRGGGPGVGVLGLWAAPWEGAA